MKHSCAWAEIDLAAYRHNIESLKRLLAPEVPLMAVVKADGYGHGAVAVSEAALTAGAEWLGVARPEEAQALRREGLGTPILVFGALEAHQVVPMAADNIVATVFSRSQAESLSASATADGQVLRVHVKIDTGMGRLGLRAVADPGTEQAEIGAVTGAPGPRQAVNDLLAIASFPGIDVEGIYTHFASADRDSVGRDRVGTNSVERDSGSDARCQLDRFLDLVERARLAGLEIPLRHAANSAALIAMPESHLDLVRAGIATYGFCPAAEMNCDGLDLRPAMHLKSRIIQLQKVPADTPLSYGGSYRTKEPTMIATVSIGYADGLSRGLSPGGTLLVGGRRAPIVGRVCMDLTLIDVGAIAGVAVGDEVSIFGGCQEPRIPAEEVASLLNTIHYEIVSTITARVPRLYLT